MQAAWISILIKQLLGMQPFNNSRFIAFVSSPPSRPSSATLMDVAGMDGIKLRKCAEREDHLKKTLEGNMWLLSHDGDGKDSDRKPYRKKFFRPLPLSQLLEDLQEPEPRPEPDCKLPTLCWHALQLHSGLCRQLPVHTLDSRSGRMVRESQGRHSRSLPS